ncbi:hypothetical protein PP178_03880 [Zeaxanthinibacter sp. PT1]|uniref:hypothetical protein n=1 Tax=Zeaxanthinibacter TaxID=561554 RepID=UPI00234A1FE8|nr:hypothetical protein [Zeaxanthinibacter sp. PT1]MDC6350679.1 hypothetical protein [Zeaxanthinibacter sp. PT1]
MQFFREEQFKVIVDPEIKVIKEFRNLIAKDKDRQKREAVKWFAYIYYTNDYRSPLLNYPAQERHARTLDNVGLPADFKIFKELEEATAKYNEFQETATVRSLKAIKNGLITSSQVINMLNDRIDTVLSSGDLAPELYDEITKNVSRMLELSDKLPKAIDTIADLEEKIKKEQAADVKIRGGGQKGAFED